MDAKETDSMKTWIYKRTADCPIHVDIHEAGNREAPWVVLLHGGGLLFGSRKDIALEKIRYFLEKGCHVAVPDYRLAPESGFQEILGDLKDFHSWLWGYGRSKGMAAFGFFCVGYSAGGFLALHMGAMDPPPRGVASFYGYGNLSMEWCHTRSPYYAALPEVEDGMIQGLHQGRCLSEGHRSRRLYYVQLRQRGTWAKTLMGSGTEEACARKIKEATVGITSAYPPVFLVHGEADADVPLEAAQALSHTLIRKGVRQRLMVLPGRGHDFDFELTEATTRTVYDALWSFFQEKSV